MKFVAILVGILSIPIYYVVFAYLITGLFLAFAGLSAFLGMEPFLSQVAAFFVLPVTVTLSILLGLTTSRFLLRRWSHAATALDTRRG